MLVIAPDSADKLKTYWEKHGYQFDAVADPQGNLLNRLGQENNWRKLGRMPSLLAVDSQGAVVTEHHGSSMKDTPDFQSLMAQIGSIDADHTP